jgi:hypothetical protein
MCKDFDRPALSVLLSAGRLTERLTVTGINQDDLIERGQQVQLVGDLYRNAMTVFVSFGDGDNGAHVWSLM